MNPLFKPLGPLAMAPLLSALTTPCHADTNSGTGISPDTATDPAATTAYDPDSWQFGGSVYLWGASIGGESATGGEIDIGFSKLLKNLNFAAMGSLYANHGKWTLGSDIIYLNVDSENSGGFTIPAAPGLSVSTESDISMKAWIVTPRVEYRLVDNDKATLNGLVGARYLWIETGVKFKTGTRFGSNTRVNGSVSDNVWDGVVGVKGHFKLSDKWYLPYYADVGTGQSEYTWQAFAGVGYRFSKVDAVLGYRYAAWKFNDDVVLSDLQLHGPMLGARFQF